MDFTLEKDGVKVRIFEGPYLSGGVPTLRAIADYSRLIEQLAALKGFAADHLFDLYNKTWVDEEIGNVDRDGFIARLRKPSIHLYDELGGAMVYFEDGGLFAGHSILIWTRDGQPERASVEG